MRRVLFTGSRYGMNEQPIRDIIDSLPRDTVVIHGGAAGIDTIVDRLATVAGLRVLIYAADWQRYGNGAGPIRNQRMLDEGKPTDAYAFPGPESRGTWDMVNRLKKAGVPVVVHE